MASSDSDPGAFAEAWLREQQQFWEAFRDEQGAPRYRHAQEEWSAACERWWTAVAGTAPESLGPALNAALDHTRLCVRMALEMADGRDMGDAFSWLLSPERLFGAAASAMDRNGVGNGARVDAGQDAAQLKAISTAMEMLSRMAVAALGTVRERLQAEKPTSPSGVLDIYLEELESHYLAAAGSDEFARVAGDLVNTWVDAQAARRAGHP